MELSEKGFNFIKNKESCILYSYDDFDKSSPKKFITEEMPVKGTLTIGYGHTGSDVKKGMKISLEEAEKLVSFTFNCGETNLKTLVKDRNTNIIAEKILLYNKSKGTVLKGLINRRKAERELFIN